MTNAHVCLIGQFVVDVTLPSRDAPYKLRAGGIMHAARALWAVGCPYTICYCAPDYLDYQIAENAKKYGAAGATRFGVVTGCPNVLLIGEPREVGDQRYEFLLRDAASSNVDRDALRKSVVGPAATDALVFPGGFELREVFPVLGATKANIFADANFEPEEPETFGLLGRPFETLMYSTSSRWFAERYRGRFDSLTSELLGTHSKSVLLKENRGGSRFARGGATLSVPAQNRAIQHSVGVGDCFDAIFVALRHSNSEGAALAYASCIAAEYACTTYPEDFRKNALAWLQVPADEIEALRGVSLPWEHRAHMNIYVAAPDFENVDRRHLETLVAALRYHNFVPRLPVREHGEMGNDASKSRRQQLCGLDLQLLGDCQLVVAVLPFDDPGTLIEVGIAVERGLPVVVYDPFSRAHNLMLTELPFLVSPDLDEVMTAVFDVASRVPVE